MSLVICTSTGKLKKRPYAEEDIKEEKSIAELAAIHFSTPQDELERSLINWEESPDEIGRASCRERVLRLV